MTDVVDQTGPETMQERQMLSPGLAGLPLLLLPGLLSFLLLSACASETPPQDQSQGADLAPTGWEQELEQVRVRRDGEDTVITLVGLDEPTYSVHPDDGRNVLILELNGVSQPAPSLFAALVDSDREWLVNDGLVERVDAVSASQDGAPRTWVRIAFEEPASYVVEPVPEGLELRIEMRTGTPAVSAAPPSAHDFEWEDEPAIAEPAVTDLVVIEEAALPAPAPDRPASVLEQIRVTRTGTGVLIELRADGVLQPAETFTIPDPDRLVVDLPGITRGTPQSTISVESDLVAGVRLGVHPDKLRIVLDGGPAARGFEGRRVQPFTGGLVVAVGSGRELEDLLAATLSSSESTSPVAAARQR